jgi:hypothetical protein
VSIKWFGDNGMLTVQSGESLILVFVTEGLDEVRDGGFGAIVAGCGGLVEEVACNLASVGDHKE